MGQGLLVALIVAVAIIQCLRVLLPFRIRVALATRCKGRLPDRVIIWFAGRGACDACGGSGGAGVKGQRTK